MSAAWNDYCAEVDTRTDAARMADEALSDEERAEAEEAVRTAVWSIPVDAPF